MDERQIVEPTAKMEIKSIAPAAEPVKANNKPAEPVKNIAPAGASVTVGATKEPSGSVKRTFAVPTTMYMFERDWKMLKNDKEGMYNYLKV